MTKLKIILNSPGKLETKVFSDFVKNGKVEVVDILFWDINSYLLFPSELNIPDPVPMWDSIERGLNGDFGHVDLGLFSANIESYLREIESATLEMMERLDPSRSQTYQQRKNLYIYLVCYWIKRLEEFKPDVFYTRSSPHEVVDFIAFHLCKAFGIKVITFIYTSLPGLFFCGEDYRFPIRLYGISRENSNIINKRFYKDFVKSKISKKLIPPGYTAERMSDINSGLIATSKQPLISRATSDLKFIMRQLLFSSRLVVASVKNNIDGQVYWLNKLSRYASSYASLVYYRRISGEYSKYLKKDKPKNFVYFLLQFQPENTTSPLGGRYNNMALAVSMLSKALPHDWALCVKEHPGQFIQNSDRYGYIGRNPMFYKQLADVPNVQLIPTDVDHDDWLDSANCVATITGTVGWEAVLKKKPTIIFGEAWYQDAPGVTRVNSVEDCRHAIEQLTNSINSITETSIIEYIEHLSSQSVCLYFDSDQARWHGMEFDFQGNADRLEAIFSEILPFQNIEASC